MIRVAYVVYRTRTVFRMLLRLQGARVAYAISALPFTTEFLVKPGRTGSVARWVNIWVQPRVDSQTWDLCE